MPMLCTDGGRLMLERDWQLENINAPTAETLLGKVTSTRPMQPSNTLSPNCRTASGMKTLDRF